MVRPSRVLRGAWRQPPPVYARTEDGVRHATWLELFFDLVFVVAVAELGSLLHGELTAAEVLRFAGVFLLVWWVWMAYSYYADLYEVEDAVSRATFIAVMFVVVFLSQTFEGALHGDSFAFTAALVVLRAVVAGLYVRARHAAPEAGRFLTLWTASEVVTTAILLVSLFVPEPGRYGLWAAAFVLNMAGVVLLYTVFEPVVVQVSHFPERLGLMTIIVLGETMLAVAFGTTFGITGPGLRTSLIGSLGFLIAVAAWWLYFERYDEDAMNRSLHPEDEHWREARRRGLNYSFSHYFVHIGIVAAGVGITAAVEASAVGGTVGTGGQLALTGGVAVFLVGCSICHRSVPEGVGDVSLAIRIAVATLLAVIPLAGLSVTPLAIVAVAALALVGVIVAEGTVPGLRSTVSTT